MKTILLFSLMIFAIICNGQKTQIENVRTEIDPQELKVIVTYDLKSKNPYDSIAVRFFANGKPITAITLSGDLGYSVPMLNDRQIKWDFIKDGMRGNVNLVAEVYSIKSSISSMTKSNKIVLTKQVFAVGVGLASAISSYVIRNNFNAKLKTLNNLNETLPQVNGNLIVQTDKDIWDKAYSEVQSSRKVTLFYSLVGFAVLSAGYETLLILAKKKNNQKKISLSPSPNNIGMSVNFRF